MQPRLDTSQGLSMVADPAAAPLDIAIRRQGRIDQADVRLFSVRKARDIALREGPCAIFHCIIRAVSGLFRNTAVGRA